MAARYRGRNESASAPLGHPDDVGELHDRAGEFTSVLFTQQRFPTASELLLGGSIFPAMQNFLLAARALGLGACLTSWASYGGEQLLRDAVGVIGVVMGDQNVR